MIPWFHEWSMNDPCRPWPQGQGQALQLCAVGPWGQLLGWGIKTWRMGKIRGWLEIYVDLQWFVVGNWELSRFQISTDLLNKSTIFYNDTIGFEQIWNIFLKEVVGEFGPNIQVRRQQATSFPFIFHLDFEWLRMLVSQWYFEGGCVTGRVWPRCYSAPRQPGWSPHCAAQPAAGAATGAKAEAQGTAERCPGAAAAATERRRVETNTRGWRRSAASRWSECPKSPARRGSWGLATDLERGLETTRGFWSFWVRMDISWF